jgi:hypothetical protein
MFKKRTAYAGVKIYNHLPADIKDLADDIKNFKKVLKNYLHVHSFYTVDEFFLCIKLDKYFDGNINIICNIIYNVLLNIDKYS